MKKLFCIGVSAALVAVIAVAVIGGTKGGGAEQEYLRIHIRANSNAAADQSVKYQIKDRVVTYLTPIVAECGTRQKAIAAVSRNLDNISAVAQSVLRQKGLSYSARARLTEENFPTRDYDGVTLPAGLYDALIVELGSAEGDNWWCVVYPPLCFSTAEGKDSDGITYKSKIADIIKKFFN